MLRSLIKCYYIRVINSLLKLSTMKNLWILFVVGLGFNGYSQKNTATELYANGTVRQKVQVTGKNTAIVKNYAENGQLVETGTRKNGFKDKSWISYFENGSIATIGNFNNGFREGTWLIFDENGKVKYEVNYEKNRVVNAYDWNSSMAVRDNK
jgi:antitoxin component YwqK of YwqJK toxin-antitoxin module